MRKARLTLMRLQTLPPASGLLLARMASELADPEPGPLARPTDDA